MISSYPIYFLTCDSNHRSLSAIQWKNFTTIFLYNQYTFQLNNINISAASPDYLQNRQSWVTGKWWRDVRKLWRDVEKDGEGKKKKWWREVKKKMKESKKMLKGKWHLRAIVNKGIENVSDFLNFSFPDDFRNCIKNIRNCNMNN